MPKEAKLFLSSSESAVRGCLRKIPPRGINFQKLRQRIEPEIVDATSLGDGQRPPRGPSRLKDCQQAISRRCCSAGSHQGKRYTAGSAFFWRRKGPSKL